MTGKMRGDIIIKRQPRKHFVTGRLRIIVKAAFGSDGVKMSELLKRTDDLKRRAETNNMVTHTGFLTPAEAYEVNEAYSDVYLSGGGPDCERVMAFFLPDYIEPEYFDVSEYISAVKIEARFAELSHRDYLGAFLGLGLNRDSVGDIIAEKDRAYVYCLPAVADFAVLNLDKVGRYGAKAEIIPLDSVPERENNRKEINFSVMSLRLDAVVAGMFGMSRTAGMKLVESGLVSLNYKECIRPDKEIKDGDIISARGYGKGVVKEKGGTSRRGRTFISAEIFK